jgi:hypothetical protein
MGGFLVSFQPTGKEVLVRSTEYHGASLASQTCLECTKVCNSSQLQEFVDRVLDAPENTPQEYLSFEQLPGIVNGLKQECRRLRSQVSNLKRSPTMVYASLQNNQYTNHPMHCPFCPPSLQGMPRTL